MTLTGVVRLLSCMVQEGNMNQVLSLHYCRTKNESQEPERPGGTERRHPGLHVCNTRNTRDHEIYIRNPYIAP